MPALLLTRSAAPIVAQQLECRPVHEPRAVVSRPASVMTPMPDIMRLDSSPYQRFLGLTLESSGDGELMTQCHAGVPPVDLRIDWRKPARASDLVAVGRTLRASPLVAS